MKISVIAVGRASKKSEEKALYEHYASRLRWKFELKEVEVKKKLSVEENKKKEGELLLSAVPKGAFVFALDERGKGFKSEEFAAKLQKVEDSGVPEIAFLIGGADGLSDEVRKKVDFLLSFGKMVWPHMLVRAMIVEQVYRAKTIIDGHPYHRA